MNKPVLCIAVPCYNEQPVLAETAARLRAKLTDLIAREEISGESFVLFSDDGSRDATWEIITELNAGSPMFRGVKLSRNVGHQNALLAALTTAREISDVTISMDADLQDDIDAVDRFLEKFREGCDIVYGVRRSRVKDTFFKRTSARAFYRLMRALGADIVYDHADYRLMSRRALEALGQFDETELFLRGMVPLIGFKSDTVEYERGERFAGESKYPLKKMLAFALDGITSFSAKPLRFITGAGFLILLAGIVALFYIFALKLAGRTTEGWATLMGSVWLMGGLQIFAIGIVGEYIHKIFTEVKHRPKYIVEQFLDGAKNTERN